MAKLRISILKDMKRIKAFTLFESVVAISIISVLIGLGSLTYSNLVMADNPLIYYQAKNQIDIQLHNLNESQAFISRVFEFENYRVEQNCEQYKGNKNLVNVTFLAMIENKEILREQHLMIHD